MIRIFCYHLIALLVSLICVRCATVSSPTGGLKDDAPPILVATTVENGSTNFNEKSIILTFNEFVKLDNPSQNVYSSPPLGNSVSFITKKNKLLVIFKEELEENTTYHLNFGNSIQDVNESNPINNYHLVFATGDQIDSLSYQGRINPINNAEITENTLVGLYKEEDDSVFLKKPPFYFTFVEDNGNFVLDYLKAGVYHAYALTDRNNNYYYDLPNEAIGFLDSSLILNENQFLGEIQLFVPEASDIRVQSFTTTVSNYKIEHEFSRAIPLEDSLRIELITDSLPITFFVKMDDERKKTTTWLGKSLKSQKSIQSILFHNNGVLDTFQHAISQLEFPKFELEISTTQMTKNDSLIIELSNPMDTPCLNIAIIDTLNGDSLALSTHKITDFQLVTNVSPIGKPNVVYTLLTPLSCLQDIYGQHLNVPGKSLKFIDDEERGTLMFNFENGDSTMNYLVELQNDQNKTVLTNFVDKNISTWVIGNLQSGNYSIQIIEDANKNGVWNSGSLIPRKHPERIYSYPKEFVLRPNWELEESINLASP